MADIWSDDAKYRTWLHIEILACEAANDIPFAELKELRFRAHFDADKIAKLEQTTRHETLAFLACVEQYVGGLSKWLHRGLTSSDIIDTGTAVQLKKSLALLRQGQQDLKDLLRAMADKYKWLTCIGRTHGMHAELMPFSHKFEVWHDEAVRNLDRLREIEPRVIAIKLRGPVGTFNNIDRAVEQYVAKRLGMPVAGATTQVVQRDAYAEYVQTLAVLATGVEKIALEIRHLQRTEVGEVEEPFYKGQQGSSAMPHKHNPITCENLCGLARLMRAYAGASLENNALWHERDMSHSSVERIILPDASVLLDYMLSKMCAVLADLTVNTEVIEQHATAADRNWTAHSEKLLLALMQKKGMPRTEAYKHVQSAMNDKSLLLKLFTPEELGDIMDSTK